MAGKEISLTQKDIDGTNVQIKLIEGRELQVVRSGKKLKHHYSIDILSLKDASKKTLSIAWKWLFFTIFILILTMLMVKILPQYIPETSGKNNNVPNIILMSGLLVTLFCFYKFLKLTGRKQILYSRNANIPIIALVVGKPSKKIFTDFMISLEIRIKQFRKHMNVPMDKQLTGEMKMLRRLADEGIIKKSQYEKAKSKLFSGFGGKTA